ncbi:LytTR family DNA-binding domain-containing protein [Peptacetobacter sp.]|uniref:LytTR family DNA-binding domain-containing protein n=1 Tax=Peptacetobacter sp. TaxID=2991975 RepID=UPI00260EC3D7|nr:LytTR family DNA-binding domain-containing protein [Peptacetobacter sp.]
MKVKVNNIDEIFEENAILNLHKSNKYSDEIVSFLEKENFRMETIVCTKDGKFHYIPFFEIVFIESYKNIQIVHTQTNSYNCSKRLYELEKILPKHFSRISKSTILNLKFVKIYKPAPSGLMKAKLINNKDVYISRHYVKKVKEFLSGGK